MRAFALLLLAAVLVASTTVAAASASEPSLRIKTAARQIDLSTHLTRITLDLTVENTGSAAASSLLVALEGDRDPSLVSAIAAPSPKTQLAVAREPAADARLFRITLESPLAAGKSIEVTVRFVVAGAQTAHPREITQQEVQRARFVGRLHVPSPYQVAEQTTTVTLPSNNVVQYTRTKPVSASGSTIKYGPYHDVAPFSVAPLSVHFEAATPFLTTRSVKRLIEVSHWGNIAVEDVIHLQNTGAQHKGEFSRYDYQRGQPAGHIVRSFASHLPLSARDIYYRDVIGNISTSHVREGDSEVLVEVTPRFPLLGGWQTVYTLGYNLPTAPFLYTGSSGFKLTIPFLDQIHDTLVVEDAEVRVVLPEGAANIQVHTPFEVEQSRDVHFTYLDTTGRPVVVLKKQNLVREHLEQFTVTYTFSTTSMLQEPLLVVGFFFALFSTILVLNRIDYSISAPKTKKD
ncbi:Rpn1 protein [Capsaspora owczarzaki ATCC 30864]|uniref:Dolichyl-diphosphooligosaccharide--protein glycosyltransferase subunit 1 n=1 Tax=Capsaspora owczarzaki (strain ATCC 30864) TaxID=595528 RepID=A0A0D2WVE8_CAPO3|nr:Rpn1 protein [Capsaspora owczarzaki ATCC 30864]KJE96830.1 Rpn1 protein [Capsaspora owczarzaki ATCC 30864]|eukprot:XP_004343816.1 Rpn1 protein [Capsaspora owczarzaki ATCC 30864]